MAQADEPQARGGAGAPPRWTLRGSDWMAIRASWGLGVSLRKIAEDYGVDRAAVQARAREERWSRDLSDGEMMGLIRRVTLAGAIRDMLAGAGEGAIERGRQIKALETILGLRPARRASIDGPASEADADDGIDAETGSDAGETNEAAPETSSTERAAQTGEAGHERQDVGDRPGGGGARGGYDACIRRAIVGRLERLGISVADAGARLPAGAGRQPFDAARQMAPPDAAGAGADAA